MLKPILVTGATGNQGGAVLDALIKQNDDSFVLLALTRNATSPAAKRMSAKSKSIQVLQGDMDNPNLIFSEAQKELGVPVWGVFMVQVHFFQAIHSIDTNRCFTVRHCRRSHSGAGRSSRQEIHRRLYRKPRQNPCLQFRRPWRRHRFASGPDSCLSLCQLEVLYETRQNTAVGQLPRHWPFCRAGVLRSRTMVT